MKRVWLITGCSSGLGRRFVPAIIARGDNVIATARNITALNDFAGQPGIKTMQLDVTDSQKTLDAKFHEALSLFGHIDVLINNAGYVGSGVWEEICQDDALQQYATNLFGTINLTRSVLPYYRARQSGTVVFMSSIAAWRGVGAGGLYSSSKFALEGAVECLREETSHLKINMHLIVLGQFRTEILNEERGRARRPPNPITDYDSVAEGLSKRHLETDGRQPGNPELAIERIIDLVRREGPFKGAKTLPLRIPLGSDAVHVMRTKCREIFDMLDEYEELARSTDYPDADGVPNYR